jgi:hypothetical protein
MNKQTTKIILTLFIMILLLMQASCKPINKTQKKEDSGIEFIHNNQIHLNSIPGPCKRIEVIANGSVGLRNVILSLPTKEQVPIKVDNGTFIFTPEIPGDYSISYEYTFTNHFEHLEPEYNDSKLVWEKGDLSVSISNSTLPEGYEKVSSQNQYLTIYYPKQISSSIVDLVLEFKPLPKPAIMTMDIKDYANFPEVYHLSGKQLIRLPFPLYKNYLKNGINIDLLDKDDSNKKIDSLLFKLDIPFQPTPQTELVMNGEDPADWVKHSVYYLENGDLKVWDFKNKHVYVLLSGKSLTFLALSPDRKNIAVSTMQNTFLCDYDGKNLKQIGTGLIRPQFINQDEILMIASSDWKPGKSVTFGNVTINQNVYEMPLQIYQIQKSRLLEPKIMINVFLGDRWSMYYPTFADFPTDCLPFKMSEGHYLFKLNFIGSDRWVSWNGKIAEEYTKENVPWFPFKPYISNEFAFEGDIGEAILQKVTYNNGDDILYIDPCYANLSLPDNQNRYLAFVRTVKDNWSAPSFYIETLSELCVFDKLTKKIMRLPIQTISALKLGINS